MQTRSGKYNELCGAQFALTESHRPFSKYDHDREQDSHVIILQLPQRRLRKMLATTSADRITPLSVSVRIAQWIDTQKRSYHSLFNRPARTSVMRSRVHSVWNSISRHFSIKFVDMPIAPRPRWIQRSLEWETEQTFRSQLIRNSTIYIDQMQKVVCAYYTHLLPDDVLEKLCLAVRGFAGVYPSSDKGRTRHIWDTRHHGPMPANSGLAYFSLWQELGHPEKGIWVSKDTVRGYTAVADLVGSLEDLTSRLAAVLCALDPIMWSNHHAAVQELIWCRGRSIRVLVAGEDECFTGRTLLFNLATRNHVDKNDGLESLAVMVCLGDYQGGHLVLPDLGIKLDYRPGHVVVLRAGQLVHFVSPFTGQRSVVVCLSSAATRKAAKKMGDKANSTAQ